MYQTDRKRMPPKTASQANSKKNYVKPKLSKRDTLTAVTEGGSAKVS